MPLSLFHTSFFSFDIHTWSALKEADLERRREQSPVTLALVMLKFSELLPSELTWKGRFDSPFCTFLDPHHPSALLKDNS